MTAAPLSLEPPLDGLAAAIGRAVGRDGTPPRWPATVDDTAAFLKGMRRHGAEGMLAIALSRTPHADIPAPLRDAIMEQARRNTVAALLQNEELKRLLTRFDQAEIPVLTLKGIVLSQALFDTIGARRVGDIDLLIAPQDFDCVHSVLTELGYAWLGDSQPGSSPHAKIRTRMKDVVYRHGAGHVLELHLSLWEQPYPEQNFMDLWERRQLVAMPGYQAATLPDDFLPVYLVAHGVHHCWERLTWLADLAVLCGDDTTHAACASACDGLKLKHEFVLATTLADYLFGTSRRRLSDLNPETQRFLRFFYLGRKWLEQPARGSAAWVRREILVRVWQVSRLVGWRRRWRVVVKTLVNPVDITVFPLPPALYWLYPALRPVGWLWRNFLNKRKH